MTSAIIMAPQIKTRSESDKSSEVRSVSSSAGSTVETKNNYVNEMEERRKLIREAEKLDKVMHLILPGA
ncbi:hypothetical protein TIFTF001_030290 [Ficus carica]|uniref:Uncharacterized protein n=1 Tax=Ficus carica TaxID=3494 RepID=A0AA88DT32_FICCA|nr:hypothetical protein TIFTF001_030290 [Ficus carica]